MKKILFLLVALVATISLSAQTVEKSKFFDNTYIGINTGVSGWLHPTCNGFDNFGNSIKSLSGLRLGKMVTPILGFEIDGEVGMANQLKFVDHTTVGANMLFNMNNSFHPYRGEPDKVEFVPFIGLGWHRTYDIITNNLASKFGMQVNFNLGEKKAWQVNIIPSINYIMTDNGFSTVPTSQPRFDACRSFVNLQVGVTYKFKNSKGTHNFVISPYQYTQADIDELMDEINSQREVIERKDRAIKENKRVINQLTSDVNTLKTENETKETEVDIPTTVGFKIGDSSVNSIQRGNLIRIANTIKENDLKVTIVGYADKNTGSQERNMELGRLRAESVANELKSLGVDDESITVHSVGSNEQLFDENDANRVVIFTINK